MGVAVEEVAVEEIAEEAAPEEAVVEESVTEAVVEEVAELEEDGPLEEWTVKELKEECKTLGVADKGKKAELIERITEARLAAKEAVVEEPVVEAAVEEAVVEEAEVEEPVEEAAPEEAAVEEIAPVEEAPVEAAPVEVAPVDAAPVAEKLVEETPVEAAADETESQSAGLDPSSISELLAKNEQGQLSQQEFFRIFLVSVQNSLTTNQRLSDVEKKLEETDARIEKLEVTGDSVSIAATEPEKPAEEAPAEEAPAEEAPAEEATPVAEEAAEEQMEETDITSLVEKKEKLQPRISRKRAQASGKQDKKSARSKRARV